MCRAERRRSKRDSRPAVASRLRTRLTTFLQPTESPALHGVSAGPCLVRSIHRRSRNTALFSHESSSGICRKPWINGSAPVLAWRCRLLLFSKRRSFHECFCCLPLAQRRDACLGTAVRKTNRCRAFPRREKTGPILPAVIRDPDSAASGCCFQGCVANRILVKVRSVHRTGPSQIRKERSTMTVPKSPAEVWLQHVLDEEVDPLLQTMRNAKDRARVPRFLLPSRDVRLLLLIMLVLVAEVFTFLLH